MVVRKREIFYSGLLRNTLFSTIPFWGTGKWFPVISKKDSKGDT